MVQGRVGPPCQKGWGGQRAWAAGSCAGSSQPAAESGPRVTSWRDRRAAATGTDGRQDPGLKEGAPRGLQGWRLAASAHESEEHGQPWVRQVPWESLVGNNIEPSTQQAAEVKFGSLTDHRVLDLVSSVALESSAVRAEPSRRGLRCWQLPGASGSEPHFKCSLYTLLCAVMSERGRLGKSPVLWMKKGRQKSLNVHRNSET